MLADYQNLSLLIGPTPVLSLLAYIGFPPRSWMFQRLVIRDRWQKVEEKPSVCMSLRV